MRPNVSKFKIYEESVKQQKYWANYADENVLLVTHSHAKPWVDLTDPVIKYVSSATPSLVGKRTPLQDFLKQSSRVREIDSDYVKWKLKGTGEVQAVQLENLHPGLACPGVQGSEFQIHLDVEWFVDGDVLAPDVAKECQVIIQGDPMSDGIGHTYNVVVVDRDPNAFFDPALLEVGLNWIKIDSVYGEGSEKYGSTIFGGMSYIEFEVELTDYGKSLEVTNKAHDLNLRVSATDMKGYPMKDYPDQIISYMEAEFLAQINWEKELRLFYGRSSGRRIEDTSIGYHRRIGPGLLEFLEDGNVFDYPLEGGSVDLFVNFLQEIWFDRVAYGDRNIIMYTGQGGLQLWNNWVTEKYAESAIQTDFNTFVKGGKSYDPKNYSGLKYPAAHFTEYAIFPFGSIKVAHWPILDSTWLNGSVLHPITGLPLTSYEFIILDYGLGQGGGNNIELLQRRDSEAFTYVCGTWSPLGPINTRTGRGGFKASGPQRRYQLFYTSTYGLRVKDITLTAWFRPAVQF